MDAEQTTREMEKLQAEIVKIQAKFAADPSEENLLKMQQEMAAISAKMVELSMQFSSDDDEDDEGDEEEIEEFIRTHPAPPGKEKYLPIGAIIVSMNYEPWQTFGLMADDDQWEGMLAGAWGINDAKEGKEMLASLLEGRHYAVYGEDFRNFKAGKPHGLDKETVEAYEYTMEGIKEYAPELFSVAKKCDNILAWDLERLGNLARVFRKLGWLSDSEMFEWLDKAAKRIKKEFPSWNEYAVSFLVGRAIAYDSDHDVILFAMLVLEEGKDLMKAHPTGSL